jgi:multidrug transporter EmrE-like cation transporter
MNNSAYGLLIIAILFGVAGQILLKYGMSRQRGFKVTELFSLLKNLPVVSGFFCYGISTLMYFKVLASLDLSLAYPTVSLGYVIVVLLSKILFKEPVSIARWAAVFIICAGVVLVGFASA